MVALHLALNQSLLPSIVIHVQGVTSEIMTSHNVVPEELCHGNNNFENFRRRTNAIIDYDPDTANNTSSMSASLTKNNFTDQANIRPGERDDDDDSLCFQEIIDGNIHYRPHRKSSSSIASHEDEGRRNDANLSMAALHSNTAISSKQGDSPQDFASPTYYAPKPDIQAISPGISHSVPPSSDIDDSAEGSSTKEEVITFVNQISHVSPSTPLTPVPPHLQKKITLAALYQNSRRSRATPQAVSSTASIPKPPLQGFPIPPPPFTASAGHDQRPPTVPDSNDCSLSLRSSLNPSIRSSQSASLQSSALRSSTNSSISQFQASWGTSMGSLMGSSSYMGSSVRGLMQNKPQGLSNLLSSSSISGDCLHQPPSAFPPKGLSPCISTFDDTRNVNVSLPSTSDLDPNKKELANATSENMCMERLSRFSLQKVRSRSEFESSLSKANFEKPDCSSNGTKNDGVESFTVIDANVTSNPSLREKKKIRKSLNSSRDDLGLHTQRFEVDTKMRNNEMNQDPQTPDTIKSTFSNSSFDIMLAFAASDDAISTGHDISAMMNESILAATEAKDSPPEVGNLNFKPHHDMAETGSEKHRRIVRRKVQRLLLLKHATCCPIPLPPGNFACLNPPTANPTNVSSCANGLDVLASATVASGSNIQQINQYICPVTSHCAEGKALCAHIRNCKRNDCKYKKCLTSREVLGHYIHCRDRLCEICSQVRSTKVNRKRGNNPKKGEQTTSTIADVAMFDDDSSIETIEDEEWVNANM
ncbi:hypothetical protein ACHAXS_004245 [Conticribra weissflogii]